MSGERGGRRARQEAAEGARRPPDSNEQRPTDSDFGASTSNQCKADEWRLMQIVESAESKLHRANVRARLRKSLALDERQPDECQPAGRTADQWPASAPVTDGRRKSTDKSWQARAPQPPELSCGRPDSQRDMTNRRPAEGGADDQEEDVQEEEEEEELPLELLQPARARAAHCGAADCVTSAPNNCNNHLWPLKQLERDQPTPTNDPIRALPLNLEAGEWTSSLAKLLLAPQWTAKRASSPVILGGGPTETPNDPASVTDSVRRDSAPAACSPFAGAPARGQPQPQPQPQAQQPPPQQQTRRTAEHRRRSLLADLSAALVSRYKQQQKQQHLASRHKPQQPAPRLEPQAHQRRHSTYLLAQVLTDRAAASARSSSEDDDDDDDLGAEDASDCGSQLASIRISRSGSPASLHPASGRLPASASSPSALATPTNERPTCKCCPANCGPASALAADAQPPASELGELATLAKPDQSPLRPDDLGRPQRSAAAAGTCARSVGRNAKRHSLINSLGAGGNGCALAGAQLASRLSHPRLLFAQPAARPVQLQPDSYDPLIPESGFKIVVMGTSGSGKTSIIQRFLYDSFDWRHFPTVEDTYFIEFPYLKSTINISISDTSGTYQFPAMRRLAINSGDAFVLVYSVDDPRSFDDLEQLRQSILEERERSYLEASTSANSATGNSSTRSSLADCSLASLEQQQQLQQQPQPQTNARLAGRDPTSRHWSLASLFSHHNQVAQQLHLHQHHQQQQQQAHQTHQAGQARKTSCSTGSSFSSSSAFCSPASSNCSSADNSRRSSLSAAELALKTRRTRHPPMVIVANKYDLPADRHLVNSDEIEALVVIDWNNGFVRASAAMNMNINDIFQQVLKQARQPPNLSEAIVGKRRKSLPPKLTNNGLLNKATH